MVQDPPPGNEEIPKEARPMKSRKWTFIGSAAILASTLLMAWFLLNGTLSLSKLGMMSWGCATLLVGMMVWDGG